PSGVTNSETLHHSGSYVRIGAIESEQPATNIARQAISMSFFMTISFESAETGCGHNVLPSGLLCTSRSGRGRQRVPRGLLDCKRRAAPAETALDVPTPGPCKRCPDGKTYRG